MVRLAVVAKSHASRVAHIERAGAGLAAFGEPRVPSKDRLCFAESLSVYLQLADHVV